MLVTGATGFIGRSLCNEIHHQKIQVIATARFAAQLSEGLKVRPMGTIDGETAWTDALHDVDLVIHLAARVHVMHDTDIDPLTKFRVVNVDGTLNLARQAAETGVQRFIFLSSIKVNGEQTLPGKHFIEQHKAAPQDLYAISKWEAEQGLMEIAQKTRMEVVIIRPPLVYGPGVKANFLTMMRWLNKRIPLPLGAIHNHRSLVALDNLIDLIITCFDHPAAANQVFLAGDGEDLSTTELLRRLGLAMGNPACLLPIPVTFLQAGAALLGQQNLAQRLCGSLQVDISKARNLL
ncbi:MAG: SDR family oxidoreductase, partial [Chlorobium sp.]|nr:SDR family oxidoreductase [Chlorobium sp.]